MATPDTLRNLNARLSALGDELDAAVQAYDRDPKPETAAARTSLEVAYATLADEHEDVLTAHLEAQRDEIATLAAQARRIRSHLDGTASEPEPAQAPVDTALVLRYCRADRSSHGGFVWPESGPVTCSDWRDNRECGNGLHGWLWGEGDAGVWEHRPDDIGMVVEVAVADLRDLSGKVKYERGVVVFCGPRHAAADYILAHGGAGRAVIGAIATAGARGTATAGARGTATAGDDGTATAGARGTATAGARGTATAGYAGTATAGARGTATAGARGTATAGARGTATAGAHGTATAGDDGTATAGARGTATAGARGTATAGARGTATAGYAGTATAGARGTATAGYAGTATAGYAGTIQLSLWDSATDRRRIKTAYVGEDGIEPGVAYRLDAAGAFVRAVPS
jgi:hypothetical protein